MDLQRRPLTPGVRLPCSLPSHRLGDGVWGLGDPLCSGFLRIPVFKGEETGWPWASSLHSRACRGFYLLQCRERRTVASPDCCDQTSQAWAVGPDFLMSLHSSDDWGRGAWGPSPVQYRNPLMCVFFGCHRPRIPPDPRQKEALALLLASIVPCSPFHSGNSSGPLARVTN